MGPRLRWRFDAAGTALRTKVGEHVGGRIRVRSHLGRALYGPYLELPPGRATARVLVAGFRSGVVKMDVTADKGKRLLAQKTARLGLADGGKIELDFHCTEWLNDVEVRLTCRLGARLEITRVEIDLERDLNMEPLTADRPVGYETSKTYAEKIESGFFDRYLSGPNIMEVGYKGYDGGTVPVVPQAIGVDIGYAGYDGTSFPFEDESFDGIYSSHCFEHIGPWKEVLQDWYRILKPGGFLVIVVPHQFLFERKRHLPSYFNHDHKRYYTARSLLAELEEAFEENSYRIRHLIENDKDFDYQPAPDQGSSGCYEIELVVEKIVKPYWTIDDGSVRAYPAGEFRTSLPKSDPWSIELDLSEQHRCLLYGPYIALPAGDFEAEFYIDGVDAAGPLPSLLFDVAQETVRIASAKASEEETGHALIRGKVVIPFCNDRAGSIFEFRTFSNVKTSTMKPRFKGVVVRYAAAPR